MAEQKSIDRETSLCGESFFVPYRRERRTSVSLTLSFYLPLLVHRL